LAERLPELQQKLPLLKVVLFGSYAKGNYTAGSDVDVLVVYRGSPRPDAYEIVWETLRIPRLEPHVYSEEKQRAFQETLARMTKDGSVSRIVSEGQHGSLPRKTWRRKEGRPPCGTKPARKS